MHADDLLAIAAVRTLGLLRTDGWPMVAAHLVAAGAEGTALVELAGLSRAASGWEIDQLLGRALREADVPDLDVAESGQVVARVLAARVRSVAGPPDHVIVRTLAALAPALGYPAGVIGDAFYAAEWLDCDCHRISPERDACDALERELRARPALDVDGGLLGALVPDPLE